jgi:hypothetical protein
LWFPAVGQTHSVSEVGNNRCQVDHVRSVPITLCISRDEPCESPAACAGWTLGS